MYSPQEGKPSYNQPQPGAATGFPVSYNSNTSTYSGTTSSDYQPVPPPPPKPIVEWSSGLCDCCSDPTKSMSPTLTPLKEESVINFNLFILINYYRYKHIRVYDS